MENFDRDLKKAAEEFVMSEYSADVPSDLSDEAKAKIESLFKEETMEKTKKYPMKRGFKVLLAVAIITLLGVVAAASPQIIEYINMKFLREDSSARLTEVPEGYIGIYDAEDLDNVRNDLTANYILMNDIVITDEDYASGGIFEGGFEPIGDSKESFEGIFNGNGCVIDGLIINSIENYVGLFANCERFYESPDNDGEKGNVSGGLVKNLGLTNGKIEVTYAGAEYNSKQLFVGAVAGNIDYLVGCFVDNFDITVENTTGAVNVSVGGLAGIAEYIDSCYSTADITVTNPYIGEPVVGYAEYTPTVGGIAGRSYSCVTSYFNGAINSDYASEGITSGVQHYVPMVLTSDVMDEISTRLLEMDDEFSAMKIGSYYVTSDDLYADFNMNNYMTKESGDIEYLLVYPDISEREYVELEKIVAKVFSDVDFENYCKTNNIKAGAYYNYDLRDNADCTFEGFDFDYIWNHSENGTPTLKLFDGGRGK